MKTKLLYFVNVDWFFISHRLPIGLRALEEGYEVHVATTLTDHKDELENYGFKVHDIKMSRGSSGIISSLKILFKIYRLYKTIRPDLAHLVTIKPVLLGGIAARFARVKRIVSSVSGMGYIFTNEGSINLFLRMVTSFLYRFALGHKHLKVIFHNSTDLKIVSRISNLPKSKTSLIEGSGVDLQKFRFSPIPTGTPLILLASRMLIDKGVREFVEAARYLKSKGSDSRFVLAGQPDMENNASLEEKEILQWEDENIIEYWGHRNNMNSILAEASVVVLPSYREGMPKVLLEAAASGRPVITTDVPGCRDAIIPEVTGLLVPPRNIQELAKAIKLLLENRRLCENMGTEGRKLAERSFDLRIVVDKHIELYSGLLGKNQK